MKTLDMELKKNQEGNHSPMSVELAPRSAPGVGKGISEMLRARY